MSNDLSNEVERLTKANQLLTEFRDHWRDRYYAECRAHTETQNELAKWQGGNLRDGKHDCSVGCPDALMEGVNQMTADDTTP